MVASPAHLTRLYKSRLTRRPILIIVVVAISILTLSVSLGLVPDMWTYRRKLVIDSTWIQHASSALTQQAPSSLGHQIGHMSPAPTIYRDYDNGNPAKPSQAAFDMDTPPEVIRLLTPVPLPADAETNKKLIYFGTGFFGGPFAFDELPSACQMTNDAAKADAIIVHALGGGGFAPTGPGTNPKRVTVGVMYESPAIYGNLGNSYNWTFTYRRDSDVYSPYCGRFEPQTDIKKSIAGKEPLLETLRSNRTKSVAWFVSNCGAPNRRMEYALELGKYIGVDIYGGCSKTGLQCPRVGIVGTDRSCWERVAATNYKFYLSFESSHCKDYITEKFFTPMYYGVLPIVYGGVSQEDYRAVAPPHSYIDTRDFKSPKELADFLIKLEADPKEYESYFWWRKKYIVHFNRRFVGQDILCSKLHSIDKFSKYYTAKELQEWWNGPGTCVGPPWSGN